MTTTHPRPERHLDRAMLACVVLAVSLIIGGTIAYGVLEFVLNVLGRK